jgi:hypothetical protein
MPLRRRRPLLRAAAVGGGAYLAGRHAERREAAQFDEPYREPYPPTPAPAPTASGVSGDAIEKIKELAQLHDQGVLTDEEFAAQKARLLG